MSYLIELLEHKWRGLVPETLEQRALQRLRKIEAFVDKCAAVENHEGWQGQFFREARELAGKETIGE